MRNKLNESDIRRILKRLDQIEDSLKAIRRLLCGTGDPPNTSAITGQIIKDHVSDKLPILAGGIIEHSMRNEHKTEITAK